MRSCEISQLDFEKKNITLEHLVRRFSALKVVRVQNEGWEMPTTHKPDRFQLVAVLNYRPRSDESGALAHRLEDWHYWSDLPNDLKIVSRMKCYPWGSKGRDSFFDDLVQEIRPLDSIKALDSRLAKLRAFQ